MPWRSPEDVVRLELRAIRCVDNRDEELHFLLEASFSSFVILM